MATAAQGSYTLLVANFSRPTPSSLVGADPDVDGPTKTRDGFVLGHVQRLGLSQGATLALVVGTTNVQIDSTTVPSGEITLLSNTFSPGSVILSVGPFELVANRDFTFASGTEATGTISIAAGNVAALDTVTVDASAIGGPNLTFLFTAGAPVALTDVQVGGTPTDSATNLAARINLVANGYVPFLAAVPAAGVTTLTAAMEGASGNLIGISEVGANLSVSGATLTGGEADATSTLIAAAITNLPGYAGNAVGSTITVTGPLGSGNTSLVLSADYRTGIRNFLFTWIRVDEFLGSSASPIHIESLSPSLPNHIAPP